jgi:hypothetical protein
VTPVRCISSNARSGRSGPGRRRWSRPKVQRGQQRIHQAAGPGPVGGLQNTSPSRPGSRTPASSAPVHAEPVLAADEAAQVADQRTLRNQRPLGRPGGAAGVDQHALPTNGPQLPGRRARTWRSTGAAIEAHRRMAASTALAVAAAGTPAPRARTGWTAASPPRPSAAQRHVRHRRLRSAAAARWPPGRRGARLVRPEGSRVGCGLLQFRKCMKSTTPQRGMVDDCYAFRTTRCALAAQRPAPAAHLGDVEAFRPGPAKAVGASPGSGRLRRDPLCPCLD